jgi:hypothetical protein
MIVKRYRKVDFFFRMLHAAYRIAKVNAAAAAIAAINHVNQSARFYLKTSILPLNQLKSCMSK